MIRTNTPEFIAERDLVAVTSAGVITPFSIRIGKPYHEIDQERWACPLIFDGLETRYADIRGVDSFQAMTLALSFARRMLEHLTTDGYTFCRPSGETMAIDQIFS